MAHEFDSGLFVREPAWHGLGNVLDTPPADWAEARKLAGIEWEPIEQPIYGKRLQVNAETGQPEEVFEQMTDFKEIVRSDTYGRLGITTDTWELINHADMEGIYTAILAEQKDYEIETLLSLRGGAHIVALFRLGTPLKIKGDPSETKRYFALQTKHDGSGALKASTVNMRIVCANTARAAEIEAERSNTTYTFWHTKNWKNRLNEIAKEAQQAIQGAAVEMELYQEFAEEMASKKVIKAQVERFIEEMFPLPDDALMTKRVQTNIAQARGTLRDMYESKTCDGIRGTAYGLWHAGIEYADHGRPYRSRESYAGRSLIKPQALKLRAKDLALAASAKQL